jgi:hypothetical protein
MMRRLALPLLLTLCTAVHATAQDWHERIWISANGGVQSASSRFTDTIDLQQFVETGSIATDYPVKAAALADGSVGVRLWKSIGAGVAVTRTSSRGSAVVNARIPHPFFDNQFRTVQGATSVSHSELGVHLQIAYLMQLSPRLRMILSAGPSRLSVEQTFVTDVQYAQSYPFDTATYTGATTHRASKGTTGFNAGADVFWMLGPNVGVGGVVRFMRATARETVTAGHTVSLDVGGVQTGGGIRLVF